MKKIVYIIAVCTCTITVASCDYDDSNDIDILKPNDSTQTATALPELGN